MGNLPSWHIPQQCCIKLYATLHWQVRFICCQHTCNLVRMLGAQGASLPQPNPPCNDAYHLSMLLVTRTTHQQATDNRKQQSLQQTTTCLSHLHPAAAKHPIVFLLSMSPHCFPSRHSNTSRSRPDQCTISRIRINKAQRTLLKEYRLRTSSA
jgi:hypothetical protein